MGHVIDFPGGRINGTTERDLEALRRVLSPAKGWASQCMPDDGGGFIALDALDRTSWVIGREAGKVHAFRDGDPGDGFGGLASVEAAARLVGAEVGSRYL
jgi:hypothetical protein